MFVESLFYEIFDPEYKLNFNTRYNRHFIACQKFAFQNEFTVLTCHSASLDLHTTALFSLKGNLPIVQLKCEVKGISTQKILQSQHKDILSKKLCKYALVSCFS